MSAISIVTLAITALAAADGPVACWGLNDDGQSQVPATLGRVRMVAGGSFHSVAVKSDGTVAAWGRNDYGQLLVPAGLASVEAVATSGEHTLALRTDSSVLGWGRNDYGQAAVPKHAAVARSIAAGNAHSVVVLMDGTVRCWGYNSDGECDVPADLGAVMSVAAGGYHNAALRPDGSVRCWGYNGFGECNTPADLGPAVRVSASGFHTAAILQDGLVRCWGRNDYGQCTVPSLVGTPVEITTGALHTGVRFDDGRVQFWGGNFAGQCLPPAGVRFGSLSAGSYHTMGVVAESCGTPSQAVRWRVEDGGNGHSYLLVPTSADWLSARAYAEASGGHLATITSAEEGAFIAQLAGATEMCHVGGRVVNGQWSWVTGEAWDYTNWNPGEPNNQGGAEEFLLFFPSNTRWNDMYGGHPAAFVNEWPAGANPCSPACGSVNIPANALQWKVGDGGNGHYYARIPIGLTWQQARLEAEARGGYLATITSAAENAFITPLVIDGGFNVSHIGGFRSNGGWAWITGEAWGYTNWYPGEPNNASGDEIYLSTWVTPGTWNDVFPSYAANFLVEWEFADCNANALCDQDEIAAKPGLDLNHDGTLDTCQCIADVVVDGVVDGVDLARILNDWGPTTTSAADIDGDGLVNGLDLAVVLSAWGPCTP